MNKTPIEWCDFSANPLKYRAPDGRVVWACVKTSPGCTNCYAEKLSTRYGGVRRAGDWNAATMATLTPFIDEAELRQMLTAKTIGKQVVAGARVFVGDMTDIFGEWVPDELLDRLMAVFALRPDVTWILVTKRAKRAREYFTFWPDGAGRVHHVRSAVFDLVRQRAGKTSRDWSSNDPEWLEADRVMKVWPLPNVWLLVSAERQEEADERIPELLATPVAVRGVSLEPLLGPIDLTNIRLGHRNTIDALRGWHDSGYYYGRNHIAKLDWLILGGESGRGARPMDVAWFRSLVQQGQAAGVAVFGKQLGAKPYEKVMSAGIAGAKSSDVWLRLRDRKGGDINEFPSDLRVREFPPCGRTSS